jgi:hypothetical protein
MAPPVELDGAAIARLVLHERQGRDRGWWEQMASTYWPDSQVDLVSCTRVSYRVERRSTVWKILSLDCIYERDIAAAAVPGETFTIPADELARFRPSHAILAWHLDRRGYPVGTDLLGDDGPTERDAYYARTLEWLRG